MSLLIASKELSDAHRKMNPEWFVTVCSAGVLYSNWKDKQKAMHLKPFKSIIVLFVPFYIVPKASYAWVEQFYVQKTHASITHISSEQKNNFCQHFCIAAWVNFVSLNATVDKKKFYV